jgi:hypothetical protein
MDSIDVYIGCKATRALRSRLYRTTYALKVGPMGDADMEFCGPPRPPKSVMNDSRSPSEALVFAETRTLDSVKVMTDKMDAYIEEVGGLDRFKPDSKSGILLLTSEYEEDLPWDSKG